MGQSCKRSWSVVIFLTVKGEGIMVSMSRPILRAILNEHTFNVDPLSISTIETLAPMHLIVIARTLYEWFPLKGNLHRKRWENGDIQHLLWWWPKLLQVLSLWALLFQTMLSITQLGVSNNPLTIPKWTYELESSSFGLKPYLFLSLLFHQVQ